MLYTLHTVCGAMWRDERVSRCTLKRANQNCCRAGKTQVRIFSSAARRGIPQQAAHLFACFRLSSSIWPAIFKDGRCIEGLRSLPSLLSNIRNKVFIVDF